MARATKLDFQKRTTGDDGFGGTVVGDYATVFSEYGELIMRMGSEPVLSSRLQGVQPLTIRVRSNANTRTLDATWRAVAGDVVYAIVSPPVNVSQKNDFIDMMATIGGQTADG
jgi:hypothetical protein